MFDFIAFIRQKYAEYSASGGQKGTMVDNLATIPTGLVMSDFYNTLVDANRVNDITQWQTWSESEMDSFANKYFLSRINGSYASGFVRIGFDNKKDINITSSFQAISGTNKAYVAVQQSMIYGSLFKNSTDGFSLYYVDIPVVAYNKGDAYNINTGDISSLSGIDFTYKNVTNPNAFINGSAHETNAQFYNRLINSINDRSMMNSRSLIANLPQFFPSIGAIYISGPGNKYMMRDLISGTDTSLPSTKIDFLGKVQNNSMVKCAAYSANFPAAAGDTFSTIWSQYSKSSYPLTVEPIDLSNVGVYGSDPDQFGYPTDNEVSNSMYQGLYFDDYVTGLSESTSALFDISILLLGPAPSFPQVPLIVGANGHAYGDLGNIGTWQNSDIISVSGSNVTINGGALEPTCIGANLLKRIGVKVSGSFNYSSTASKFGSVLQVMIGGANTQGLMNAFTGIGFGVMLNQSYDSSIGAPKNATVFIAHGEQFGNTQIFVNDTDTLSNFVNISNLNAVAESPCYIQDNADYNFEFVFYDDFHVTLYIAPATQSITGNASNIVKMYLPSSQMSIFATELKNPNSESYGTMMNLSVYDPNKEHGDSWSINNIKATDISERRANSMLIMSVDSITDPLSVLFRAVGRSGVAGIPKYGYNVYLWDTQAENSNVGTSDLSAGGWTNLSSISDPNGLVTSIEPLLQQDISDSTRYVVQTKFGKSLIFLVTTVGTSSAKIKYQNDFGDDIDASINIDYIRIQNKNINTYHSNNKADVFVTTYKSYTPPSIQTITVTKSSSASFFSLDTLILPIAKILTVSSNIANTTQTFSQSEYYVSRTNPTFTGSSKEEVRITLSITNVNSIDLTYIAYPDVVNIQKFYDDSAYAKVVGDILIRHTYPITLNFNLAYSGSVTTQQMTDYILQYIDNNNTGSFSINQMISYLYNQGYASNIQQPIQVTYTRYDDSNQLVTGTFTDQFTGRDVDFFMAGTVTSSLL